MASLVAALSTTHVNSNDHIQFNNINICVEGFVVLPKVVEASLRLQLFRLHHNRIDNIESARCLSRSLKSHASIIELDLDYCDLGSSPEILLIILQSDVKYISLVNNNIDSLGAVKIAEYLESDPPIHQIDLDHNRLIDDDAILISQALKRNTKLKLLSLYSNNFTSIGFKALLNCVFNSSSLNAISESNHTLGSMNFFLHENEISFYIDTLLSLDRLYKILLALQDKDSLLQYLANVPVKLIPEVLVFSLRDQCPGRNLNIVYSTMRWWNMPIL
jgi:hypothetical protein